MQITTWIKRLSYLGVVIRLRYERKLRVWVSVCKEGTLTIICRMIPHGTTAATGKIATELDGNSPCQS
jgi:hypothetical protein